MSKFDNLIPDSKKAGKKSQPTTPRRGRPTGKRSNPDYEQVTAYLNKQTNEDARVKLIREGKRRDFSELVEELLQKWLKSGT